jgi:adenylate cyclase
MFVGNFGSRNIKNFTVMGSNVNLGSRLEAYTRVVKWPIIISEQTFKLVQQSVQAKDLGRIRAKGFTEPVQIYGLESVEGLVMAEVMRPEAG